jgi:mediator of RNA polymerase II transcription subunit 10
MRDSSLTLIGPLVTIEAQLKDIVQNLYNLMVQSFDHRGDPTQNAIKAEM